MNPSDYAVLWPADGPADVPDVEASDPTRVWVDADGGLQAEWLNDDGLECNTVDHFGAVVPLSWSDEEILPVITALQAVARDIFAMERMLGVAL